MSLSSKLFVGVTTWNSELLLPLCLDSIRNTAPDAEIVVLDNESVDSTVEIARNFSARVISRRCGQADALASLAEQSERPLSALIHADVVFVGPQWLETVAARLSGPVALVSPEDIGCGPYTRPWGKDMPESSFMCFRTDAFEKLKIRRWMRRWRIPYFKRKVDFFGDHVTYNLPTRLREAGLAWVPMNVHVSPRLEVPFYVPDFESKHWRAEFGHLKYGLGNFYSLDGQVTHYHNWYDRRVDKTRKFDPHETLEVGGGGVPVAFLKEYTENFMADYAQGKLDLPGLQKQGEAGS